VKVVNIKQNGKEWSAWRNKGLGASLAPVIMEVSPWSSPFELWTELTGMCAKPDFNPFAVAAMQRGHDLEPRARELAEQLLGAPYPAISGEHDTLEYIRASLDGYNAERNQLLEIKCPGKEDHGKALRGKVPDKYYPQLQQQFLVSGASSGVYFSWDGVSETGVAVEVLPDYTYIQELTERLTAFWSRVQMCIPPDAKPGDVAKYVKRITADIGKVQSNLAALTILTGG
jgi:putative phage-type endonuclease